eukprot:NODE_3608_length_764_cov_266.169252.p2 GENE.NODE_3608_length_764_cov_266.169252~~NODE_3608_length_764_cov_266.169252.p2  ORF type:complete len:155 (-),score=47.73 NODE_3608_length_764_cov_266.169252:183-647(-)
MAALEGTRIRPKGAVFKWPRIGRCGAVCAEQCTKSPGRILCAWRVPNTVHEHHNRLDWQLLSYKGVVNYDDVTKPIFRVRRRVALKNRYCAEHMEWDPEQRSYIFTEREDIHPAFGILPNRNEDAYAPDEQTYDSESDLELSSDEEDSDGDGCW